MTAIYVTFKLRNLIYKKKLVNCFFCNFPFNYFDIKKSLCTTNNLFLFNLVCSNITKIALFCTIPAFIYNYSIFCLFLRLQLFPLSIKSKSCSLFNCIYINKWY